VIRLIGGGEDVPVVLTPELIHSRRTARGFSMGWDEE
jgi:hypothetical protein